MAGSRWGLRGSGPALAGKLGEDELWRFAPEVEVVRFQCSLRTSPAAASSAKGSVPHINTKGATPHYFWPLLWVDDFVGIGGWVAVGAPREWSCARREALGG